MPIYEYLCDKCSFKFERLQAMKEAPLTECPECGGQVHRLVSAGGGFILKGAEYGAGSHNEGGCSLEQTGRTCCGQTERCGNSSCGEQS